MPLYRDSFDNFEMYVKAMTNVNDMEYKYFLMNILYVNEFKNNLKRTKNVICKFLLDASSQRTTFEGHLDLNQVMFFLVSIFHANTCLKN